MKHPVLSRIAALSLAALMLLSTAACATTQEDAESTTDAATHESVGSHDSTAATEEQTEAAYIPDIEKTNYNCDFNIAIGGTFNPDLIVLKEEDSTGDSLDTSIYERSVKVLEHVGAQCVLVEAGDWIQYSGTIKRSVQAGDDDYQLVLTHVYQGVCDLITSNVLYNFSDFEAVNLDAPYWAKDLMDDIQIDGKHLLGYNDMCLSAVKVVVFNKDLQEDYQIELPYNLVRDKQWTLDKMIEMASVIAVDNGDNKWDAQDTYGITGWGWVPLISFITSSDIRIVDRNAEDEYEIAYDWQNERMLALIDKIFALYDAEYSWFWKSVPGPDTEVDFSAGTSLFQLYSSESLVSFRDKDLRFGILPYPLWDEKQESYKTLNWNGLMGVPNAIKNPAMVGEVLELLAYYTAPVKDAYYENLLSAKLADAPDDVEMLDIIWATQTTDVGLIVCNASTAMDEMVYMLPKMCEAGSNTYSSYMKGKAKRAQDAIDKVFKQGKFA